MNELFLALKKDLGTLHEPSENENNGYRLVEYAEKTKYAERLHDSLSIQKLATNITVQIQTIITNSTIDTISQKKQEFYNAIEKGTAVHLCTEMKSIDCKIADLQDAQNGVALIFTIKFLQE